MIDIPIVPDITWPSIFPDKNTLLSTQYNTTDPVEISKNIGFTNKAIEVFYQLQHNGYQVYHIIEELKHNGYDMYGPKTDIWYLHIFTYDSVYKPVQLIFTWENHHLANDNYDPYYYLEKYIGKYSSHIYTHYTRFKDILEMMK
jgi:hypothetical protein